MNRRAFLLGFYSIAAQVLLIRELIGAFRGSELLIGTALFGWLLAVACGAWVWEKSILKPKPVPLLIGASIILPPLIAAVRLSPLLVVDVIGQEVSFTISAAVSIVAAVPIGLLSGAMFPSISHEGFRPAKSISRVYLFEGIGAVAGGIAATALTGVVFGNLGMAVAAALIVILFAFGSLQNRSGILRVVILALLLIGLFRGAPNLERAIDRLKFDPYQLVDSFDTPYGHNAIVKTGEAISLYSGNAREGTSPDEYSAEQLLIPPLAFRPDARNILIIGRTEFGVGRIIKNFPDLTITAVDPRKELNRRLDRAMESSPGVIRVNADPVAYLLSRDALTPYDIVIIAPTDPDNIVSSRYLGSRFLGLCRKVLSENGLLYVPTSYDSERYVSPENGLILSVLYRTMTDWFEHITIWPGPSTLFLASGKNHFEMYNDQIFDRIDSLPYNPEYFNRYYLEDRLDEIRRGRLDQAIDSTVPVNNLEHPVLLQYHALYSSQTRGGDETVVSYLFRKPLIWIIVPIGILILFILSLFRRKRHQRFGLFLFFTAGLVSLTLELLSLYLYQTMAGTLYSEIGLLFGAFMLGLAAGTWYALKCSSDSLEFPALLLLLTIIFIFLWSYENIPFQVLLIYHSLFLFVTGAATGTLFIAATARYYFGRAEANRGAGYAVEIFGSSIAALFTIAVFLPVIGLTWILIVLLAVTALALIGAYISA